MKLKGHSKQPHLAIDGDENVFDIISRFFFWQNFFLLK